MNTTHDPKISPTPARPLTCLRTRAQRTLRRGLTLLALQIALAAAAIPARAETNQIYLYNANGAPVNVTTSCYYQDHHVYDASNNLVGTVNASDQILNASGQCIGYISAI